VTSVPLCHSTAAAICHYAIVNRAKFVYAIKNNASTIGQYEGADNWSDCAPTHQLGLVYGRGRQSKKPAKNSRKKCQQNKKMTQTLDL
jgi:hypothetical protein